VKRLTKAEYWVKIIQYSTVEYPIKSTTWPWERLY